MKTLLTLLVLIGAINTAQAVQTHEQDMIDDREDYLLGNMYDSFYVHSKVLDTLVFTTEYGGPTRMIAMTPAAKAYVASLKTQTKYECTFSGKFVPCHEVNYGSETSCQASTNKVFFSAAVCREKP